MEDLKLTILMPCLNEEKTIEKCIIEAKKFLKESSINGEILVSDNGSTDRSLDIVRKHKVRYINVKAKGYGNALREGFENSLGEYIIMGDSDTSYDFYHLDMFVNGLFDGYDLVMGNRFKGGIEKGAMPLLNRYIGNPFLSWFARKLFPCCVRDFHCGLRGFRNDKILSLNLESSGMELASEIVIKSVINGFKIKEVPTVLRKVKIDRKPHLNPFRDGVRHMKLILKLRVNK